MQSLTFYFYILSINVLIITKYGEVCLFCCEIFFHLSFFSDKRDTQTIAGDDWNSLSSAVQTGNFAIIEDMLSRGLDINTKNNDGNTALILAALTGKRDAVNYL